MNLLGATTFPQLSIGTSDPTIQNGLEFGPSVSFGHAGMFQNQWEYGSAFNWVKGRHTIAFGGQWDHTPAQCHQQQQHQRIPSNSRIS